MLAFLIDNIFVMFGGRVFQQTVGISMGTNCAPLSPSWSFIHMWQTHTGASQEEQKEAIPIPQFHVPLYRWCPFIK